LETSIWNNISLSDYEKHMQHETVGQMKLLSVLTKKYLQKYTPSNVLFLGVAGGNGLEHIDANKTGSVVGVDINDNYLEETRNRFGRKIKQLRLINANIGTSGESFTKSDFVWAALILEYTDISKAFQFIANNISDSANVMITIQSNNGLQSVSQTGVESIKLVGQIFRLVDKSELLKVADSCGFTKVDFEENVLPDNKSFQTFTFRLKTDQT
jgi:hypothetical protein